MAKTTVGKLKHTVHVNEDFEVRTQLGALTTTDVRTGDVRQIAPPKEHVSTYKAGDRCQFSTKADAQAFAKHHGPKVTYLGKIASPV